MSLQKQIRRNIAKENEKLLSQFGNQLVPDWKLKSAQDKNLLAHMVRNGITAEDLKAERKRGRDEAFAQTAPIVMKTCYSAFAIVLADEFGFTPEQCYDVVSKADHMISTQIDTDELMKGMEEKAKIKFFADEGLERVALI